MLTFTTPATETATYTHAQIEEIYISHINDAGGPIIDVRFALGSLTGEAFIPAIGRGAALPSAVVVAKMAAAPIGNTIYDVIKNAVYELLQQEGHLGAGSI